jgi:lysozyme
MNRDRLRRSIQAHEGCRLRPYMDTATPPRLTIAWGRNLTDVGISQDEADAMLEHDIDKAAAGLTARWPWMQALDDVRFEVFVEMAFNLGLAMLANFHATLSAAESGRYDEAARQMLCSRWAAQVGTRAKRLAERMKTGAWS